MEMSEIIKQKRKESGLTQEELASKLGLQKSAVAKYENGRVKNIKRSTIEKMAEIFECDPVYIMGLESQDYIAKKLDDVTNNTEMQVLIEIASDMNEDQLSRLQSYAKFILSEKEDN